MGKRYTYRWLDEKRERVICELAGWPKLICRATRAGGGYGYLLIPAEDISGCEPRLKWKTEYVDALNILPPIKSAAGRAITEEVQEENSRPKYHQMKMRIETI